MHLIVNDYGTVVKKEGKRFVLKNSEKSDEFASCRVSQIWILKSSAITSEAVALAFKNDIDIIFFDGYGQPVMKLTSCLPGKNASIRRRQMEAYNSRTGNILAISLITAKIRNQGDILRHYGKSRNNEHLKRRAGNLHSIADGIQELPLSDIKNMRNSLMGYEGEASKIYFDSLKEILPAALYAGKRTRRPPGDVFNAGLSYGYGILFSVVQKGIILSGLDPYLGFLHADGNPSLVFDIMELFRQPVVDRTVLRLCIRKEISSNDVFFEGDGCLLNKAGRSRLVGGVLSRLSDTSGNNKSLNLEEIIFQVINDIAAFITSGTELPDLAARRW
jgi:CRISPR-associated protein Cas1